MNSIGLHAHDIRSDTEVVHINITKNKLASDHLYKPKKKASIIYVPAKTSASNEAKSLAKIMGGIPLREFS